MSRLKTLTDYTGNAITGETGCYGADSLIVNAYTSYLAPVKPYEAFPSILCAEIKECDDCCLNYTTTLENICRDLKLSLTPDKTSEVQQELPLF